MAAGGAKPAGGELWNLRKRPSQSPLETREKVSKSACGREGPEDSLFEMPVRIHAPVQHADDMNHV
jgi:hypothetical protein